MLIEFRVSNFRSLKDQQVLSLVAGTRKELLEENTFESGLAGFPRLTRSAVIYGANAAGKTNVLLALQFMQVMVLNSAAIQDGVQLSHMPYRLSDSTSGAPSTFEITFVDEGVRYEYGFSADAKRIHDEWLIAYPQNRPQRWFERTFLTTESSYDWHLSPKLRGNARVWRDATRQNALFLSIATQLNSEQLRRVFTWFQKKLVIVGVGPSQFNQSLTIKLLENSQGKERLLKFVQAADLGISDLILQKESATFVTTGPGISPTPEIPPPTLVRISSIHKAIDTGIAVSFDLSEESHGTQTLLRSAGAWLNVLENGEVLFVDELDTALHPHMTRFLIGLFHSQATNKKNAQLVFTTHDTSLLSADLFRRDQIWFAEKDKESASRIYPLTDFSPRKDEKLERGYLRGRYGALPFIGELRL